MNIDQFPTIKATSRRLSQISAAIDAISKGVDAGEIANATYKNAKELLSHALDDGWESQKKPFYGQDKSDFETDLIYYSPQAHTVAGMLKKISKSGVDTPMTQAAVAYLEEILPLCTAIVSLKDKVVKRQPKPAEADIRDKYNAPAASGGAMKQVHDALVKVTEDCYQSLKSNYIAYFEKIVDEYLDLCAKAETESKVLTAHETYNKRGSENASPMKYEVVRRTVTDGEQNRFTKEITPAAKRPDASEKIESYATKIVDEIRESFVVKNLVKFDSIIEKKGNFEAIKIMGTQISLSGLEGEFKVTFTDGSSFYARNSAVYSVSVLGNPFMRYPLTFHDVFLAPGKRMPLPSEEKMNTIFCGEEKA